ncbi:MAG: hypothetical protein IJR85_02800 [Synergistaceae bacterium]|nr:hypothetical protein [Synergistaceae bacterium]
MLVDVAVPEMALDDLTYSTGAEIPEGVRVIVEVQKSLHAGIVLGPSEREVGDEKPIAGVIDERMMIDPDLWDLARWSANVCMCGISVSLRAVLPRKFWMGEKLEAPPETLNHSQKFSEVHNFNPFDAERVNFCLSELEKPERTLMLFSSREAASDFYLTLPAKLRQDAILWRSPEEWEEVNSKKCRIVIGSAGAVFAPLSPERIIIEDEASSGYFLPYGLRISARSLAGRRATFLGSELVLCGRMPSLKTFMRSHPVMTAKPDRNSIVIADMYTSRKEKAAGIDGNIPLTFSLIRRTYKELVSGHNVLWILGRQGEAMEVFCPKCGHILVCDKCGNIMRSINDGEMLKCRVCGALRELPAKCPECNHEGLRGKRPGIEALAKIVSMYYPKVRLYVDGADKSRMKGLILSGHKGLELLESVKPSLVAWLDIDAELSAGGYDTRFRVFSMLYRSLYAGIKSSGERKLLVQARKEGRKLCEFLLHGWEKFLADELKVREEFGMPPSGYMIELDCGGKISRERILVRDILEEEGFFVMDSGDESQPLCVNTNSLDEIAKLLEPHHRMLNITVRSE